MKNLLLFIVLINFIHIINTLQYITSIQYRPSGDYLTLGCENEHDVRIRHNFNDKSNIIVPDNCINIHFQFYVPIGILEGKYFALLQSDKLFDVELREITINFVGNYEKEGNEISLRTNDFQLDKKNGSSWQLNWNINNIEIFNRNKTTNYILVHCKLQFIFTTKLLIDNFHQRKLHIVDIDYSHKINVGPFLYSSGEQILSNHFLTLILPLISLKKSIKVLKDDSIDKYSYNNLVIISIQLTNHQSSLADIYQIELKSIDKQFQYNRFDATVHKIQSNHANQINEDLLAPIVVREYKESVSRKRRSINFDKFNNVKCQSSFSSNTSHLQCNLDKLIVGHYLMLTAEAEYIKNEKNLTEDLVEKTFTISSTATFYLTPVMLKDRRPLKLSRRSESCFLRTTRGAQTTQYTGYDMAVFLSSAVFCFLLSLFITCMVHKFQMKKNGKFLKAGKSTNLVSISQLRQMEHNFLKKLSSSHNLIKLQKNNSIANLLYKKYFESSDINQLTIHELYDGQIQNKKKPMNLQKTNQSISIFYFLFNYYYKRREQYLDNNLKLLLPQYFSLIHFLFTDKLNNDWEIALAILLDELIERELFGRKTNSIGNRSIYLSANQEEKHVINKFPDIEEEYLNDKNFIFQKLILLTMDNSKYVEKSHDDLEKIVFDQSFMDKEVMNKSLKSKKKYRSSICNLDENQIILLRKIMMKLLGKWNFLKQINAYEKWLERMRNSEKMRTKEIYKNISKQKQHLIMKFYIKFQMDLLKFKEERFKIVLKSIENILMKLESVCVQLNTRRLDEAEGNLEKEFLHNLKTICDSYANVKGNTLTYPFANIIDLNKIIVSNGKTEDYAKKILSECILYEQKRLKSFEVDILRIIDQFSNQMKSNPSHFKRNRNDDSIEYHEIVSDIVLELGKSTEMKKSEINALKIFDKNLFPFDMNDNFSTNQHTSVLLGVIDNQLKYIRSIKYRNSLKSEFDQFKKKKDRQSVNCEILMKRIDESLNDDYYQNLSHYLMLSDGCVIHSDIFQYFFKVQKRNVTSNRNNGRMLNNQIESKINDNILKKVKELLITYYNRSVESNKRELLRCSLDDELMDESIYELHNYVRKQLWNRDKPVRYSIKNFSEDILQSFSSISLNRQLIFDQMSENITNIWVAEYEERANELDQIKEINKQLKNCFVDKNLQLEHNCIISSYFSNNKRSSKIFHKNVRIELAKNAITWWKLLTNEKFDYDSLLNSPKWNTKNGRRPPASPSSSTRNGGKISKLSSRQKSKSKIPPKPLSDVAEEDGQSMKNSINETTYGHHGRRNFRVNNYDNSFQHTSDDWDDNDLRLPSDIVSNSSQSFEDRNKKKRTKLKFEYNSNNTMERDNIMDESDDDYFNDDYNVKNYENHHHSSNQKRKNENNNDYFSQKSSNYYNNNYDEFDDDNDDDRFVNDDDDEYDMNVSIR
ncbi:hypothetical protein SNEBB_007714 [Seison nebaliae]|nr:hypothetical protein SNEBB_007714 [Seison nebaliae]